MSKKDRDPGIQPRPKDGDADVTEQLVRLMSRDLVFTMRFLGESQHRLQVHFQAFMEQEMAAAGLTRETHPMLSGFIEQHAILMREFVFSGVALSRQFRIEEIERLIGDTTALLRVDIWDQLRSHIDMAEQRFCAQLPELPHLLNYLEAPGKAAEKPPDEGK